MHARSLLTLGLVVALAGCVKEADGPGVGSNESALVGGRVFNSETNEAVKGATVKTADGKTATTDDNGYFEVEAASGKETVVTVEGPDYAKAVKAVAVYPKATSYVEVFSKPVSKDNSIEATAGGMAKVNNMTVLVPADSLENEDGTKYSGKVTVEVATVRPEKSNELSAFPGKFDGTTVDDQAGSVATRSAVSLRLLSASGQPLKMSGTQRVEMFMPIRAGFSQRNTRLWKLRDQTADWQEAEFGAMRDVDPISFEPALRSAVAALTWWNAGDPFVKSKITGCLESPEGEAPLAGIQVVATGLGYGYFAEHYTNEEGCFEIEVKARGSVAVYAQTRFLRSKAKRVMAPAAGMTDDIGMIALDERDSDCPGVMEECGGVCVDLLNDDNNCGECGTACDASEGPGDGSLVPVHCAYGSCGCDDEQILCEGGCANVQTDSLNCGDCGATCGSDGECIDGACGDVDACPGAQELCDDGSGNLVCTDTKSDSQHCGGCAPDPAAGLQEMFDCEYDDAGGNACSTGCTSQSECESLAQCGGHANGDYACEINIGGVLGIRCTDLNNSAYCGDCNTWCAPEETCNSGVCVPRTCPQGERPCGFFCRDASLSCGQSCFGAECTDGFCAGSDSDAGIGGVGGSGGTPRSDAGFGGTGGMGGSPDSGADEPTPDAGPIPDAGL